MSQPEPVEFSEQRPSRSSRLRRAIAFGVDVAVAGGPVFLASAWEGLSGLGSLYHGPVRGGPPVAVWLAVAWALAYALLRDGDLLGRSLGKRWMGLRVVATGPRRRAILRNALSLTLIFLPLLAIEAALALRSDGRRLADRLTGTRVVPH